MKFLRNRFVSRTISVFLLLIFVQSLILPEYAFALTSGPHQPEYTSYEEAGATDMVNLLTGDFAFNLPVLDVPGPEGSFSLPLTYHSGIGTDQEASWVGLGWNMNAGSINRSIFGYPDDASGEVNGITVRDLTGIVGMELNTYVFGRAGINSAQGHYGSISLFDIVNFDYSNGGVTNIGVVGVNVSDENNVSFNSVQFVSAVSTILSFGAAAAAKTAGQSAAQAITKQAATQIAAGVVSGAITGGGDAGPSVSADGYWKYQKSQRRRDLFLKSYKIWLDQTRYEEMYGTLYGHKASLIDAQAVEHQYHADLSLEINNTPGTLRQFPRSTNNKGAASDIYFNSGASYLDATGPVILATDNFSVKAPGISGAIKPYRLETASISMQREMTKNHNRFVPAAFENYKVPFVYDGLPSNAYFHHVGNASIVSSPTFYDGYSNIIGSPDPSSNTSLKFNFNDVTIGDQRIKPEVAAAGYKITQANHIEWLSNAEISASAGGFPSGFIDYFAGSQRTTFRDIFSFSGNKNFYSSSTDFTNGIIQLSAADMQYFTNGQSVTIQIDAYNTEEDYHHSGSEGTVYNSVVTITDKNATNNTITVNLGSTLISNITGKFCNIFVVSNAKPKAGSSIGGFSITGANGMTYHFAIPVYDYDNLTRVQDKNDANKYSIVNRKEPFANTWLLTSITGPDFIDRGGANHEANGIIDMNDWGYWVKFNYGKKTDEYQYRMPFSDFILDGANSSRMYTQGMKQLYYLNSIETRSHVALFLKSPRADNMGKNGSTTLKLDEITLLTRENYRKLGAPPAENGFNMELCSGSIVKLWMSSDFYFPSGSHPSQGQYLIRNATKRVKFSYNYSLCPATPNSSQSGKLTLERVSILGRNDLKIVPDYIFQYTNNFAYGADHWDGWGMYTPLGSQTSRQASDLDAHGAAWSLSKITTPIGAQVIVDIERDTYASISGFQVTNSGGVFNKKGGDVRVKAITMRDEFGRENKMRYLYNDEQNISTGVVAQEPEYIRDGNGLSFYNIPGYPVTPVMYGRVTVLNGALSAENDFHTRQVFEFETPNSGFIMHTPVIGRNKSVITSKHIEIGNFPLDDIDVYFTDYLTEARHTIADSTSKIGNLKSIKVFDKAGALKSSSKLEYTSTLNNYQGIYSESTLMFDQIIDLNQVSQDEIQDKRYYKTIKTTVLNYPRVLKRVINNKDGFTSSSENIVWDFISGQVLEKIGTSALGLKVQTIIKPAYTFYPEMGPKGLVLTNKNMLLQEGATYSYKLDASNNRIGLIAASAQRWRKDWSNYRTYNSGSLAFSDGDDEPSGIGVWRKDTAYVWRGDYSRVDPALNGLRDGTHIFSVSDEFDFLASTNGLWQYTGQVLRFDHYGMPLETKDINNIRTAVKMGYDERTVIAAAANAGYHEIAFSSAEDLYPDKPFFGGEVGLGNGSVKYLSKGQTASIHTGDAVVAVSSGYSFIFKTSGLKAQRNYKATVWTNSINGKIYYKISGGSEVTPATQTISSAVNGWYRIDVLLPTQTLDYALEIGVKSGNGTEVLFDDFRFQPVESNMTCYVYPPLNFEFTGSSAESTSSFTYILDNNNLYTKFEHNERGALVRTYRESITYGVKLLSEVKDNYRRSHQNQ